MRDADDPSTVADVETDLPTHFNPERPAERDPGRRRRRRTTPGTPIRRSSTPWWSATPTSAGRGRSRWRPATSAIRHNPDQTYVKNPDGDAPRRPPRQPVARSAASAFHPDDPSTYSERADRSSPTIPATGKAWPAALHDLLEPNGFGMAFRLETDENGDPFTTLDIFRRQDGSPRVVQGPVPPAAGRPSTRRRRTSPRPSSPATSTGSPTPSRSSRSWSATRRRSSSPRASRSPRPTRPTRGDPDGLRPERPVVLADATATSTASTSSTRRARATGTSPRRRSCTTAPSLDALLAGDDPNDPTPYVKRRRVPLGELFTPDPNQKPLKAQLAISTDYAGHPARPLGRDRDLAAGRRRVRPAQGPARDLDQRRRTPTAGTSARRRGRRMPYPAGVVKGVEDQAGRRRRRTSPCG